MTMPDVDFGAAPAGRLSALDEVRLALQARQRERAETVTLRTPIDRPSNDLVVTFRVPTDGTEIADVTRRVEAKAGKNGPVGVLMNRAILARFCEGIALDRGGDKPQPLVDDDGNALTFAHPALLDQYNATSAADVVFAMYGNDGDVASVVSQLFMRAGIGGDDTVEVVEDPTRT